MGAKVEIKLLPQATSRLRQQYSHHQLQPRPLHRPSPPPVPKPHPTRPPPASQSKRSLPLSASLRCRSTFLTPLRTTPPVRLGLPSPRPLAHPTATPHHLAHLPPHPTCTPSEPRPRQNRFPTAIALRTPTRTRRLPTRATRRRSLQSSPAVSSLPVSSVGGAKKSSRTITTIMAKSGSASFASMKAYLVHHRWP